MTFQVTSVETGDIFVFANEEIYERALDWYNETSKKQIEEFCRDRGIDLIDATDDPEFQSGSRLIEDWACVAMQAYARALNANHGAA